MIHINNLVDTVKARLGAVHRQLELSDEAIRKCLQDETLQTLSVFAPYYCNVFLDLKENEVMPGMNTYFVPHELGDDFEIMGVEAVIPSASGVTPRGYNYLPAGLDLQANVAFLANAKLINMLSAASSNPSTFQFIPPNQLRLINTLATSNVILVCRTTHKKDFTSFPMGMLETIRELAFYDVARDIYSIRKYFSNIQTLVAQISLDLDIFSNAVDKRADLVEKLRRDQLKYSNTRKIFVGYN